MKKEHTIIVGAGPCGLSTAIELKKRGINPLIIEKGNVVNSIYNYPTHQTFFSSSERLEIGEVPFITEKKKPVRNQALAYYRTVAERKQLRINSFERVLSVKKEERNFTIETINKEGVSLEYKATNVVIATGYYDQPNYMGIKGEELEKVSHYFKEAHPFFDKDVVIIGGKNSAVDAALELHKVGARITVLYRGANYSSSVKPWILPEFEALARKELINMEFNANVTKITDTEVFYEVSGTEKRIKNDFVFAMTGYQPDQQFLTEVGIDIDIETGRPVFDESTMETNIEGIFIAGVIAAGYNNNEIFIENGRFHGEIIAEKIMNK
ncbi:YpdA family putative bacillithiol disulfide reductase [Aquibacillus koreensis]|uniref:YpdA family putative bacillithiol disulfide reductase n=1 Tax=Aquibacillus koreensis TaxID=279446 RepID=A0A9X4AGN2_9BACI|nr:YpdA family putative bacillithiol disulfide reductase [Aquibacillus koreensis]MCT2537408.1 YpdA family putative bacillithiol disulfide reductase [Aquibacillus koreensis]MDC3418854.1 YpdA family putative bacillithiol disulfide reductase [Aquibacillus koreensis]